MFQTITLTVELMKPTKTKILMYRQMTERNTEFANWLLSYPQLTNASSKTYKVFSSNKMPSAIVGETVRYTASMKKKHKARTFRKCWCRFNNQNFRIERESKLYKASFPTLEKRIGVPLVVFKYQKKWLECLLNGGAKLGTTELIEKRGKWYLAIPLTRKVNKEDRDFKVMGIDLGLRNIAVAVIGTKTFFFSGREVALKRKFFEGRRKSLGRAKKLDALRKSKGKEARWMREVNHFVSRRIIEAALAEGVTLIRMEDLKGIKNKARVKKETKRHLHRWSHYQLREFICYKAALAGIKVELVNPSYTSQTCKCGYKDKRNRKQDCFKCFECGFSWHADANAAANIAKAISGLT